jgi:hypothetical protein
MGISTITGIKFPPRPSKPIWTLGEKEKMFLDMTLFDFDEAWKIFQLVFMPNATAYKCKTECNNLLGSMDAKDYLTERVRQVDEIFFPKQGDDTAEKIPDNINEIILNQAWKRVKAGGFKDSEEWKVFLTKVVKDMNTDSVMEPPRRYLAETCSACRYKVFCEGEVEDECPLCKYKEYALEHGCEEYDHKTQLNKKEDEI